MLTQDQTDFITDITRDQLATIQQSHSYPDPKVVTDLKKRKLVTTQRVISFKVDKGPNFSTEMVKEETDLTADMLATYVSDCLMTMDQGADQDQWCVEDGQIKTIQLQGHGSARHERRPASMYEPRYPQ